MNSLEPQLKRARPIELAVIGTIGFLILLLSDGVQTVLTLNPGGGPWPWLS